MSYIIWPRCAYGEDTEIDALVKRKNIIFTLVRTKIKKKSELKTLAVDFDHESIPDHFQLLMKPHFKSDL